MTIISSLFPFFLFFSAVVGVVSLGVVSFYSGRCSAASTNRGISMVLAVVFSVEKFIVSRSRGCEVIVGVVWYLDHLRTSVLVLVSVDFFNFRLFYVVLR